MIRFHFRLRPLADVQLWGDRRLHWFALTDGWYWIEVDGHKLFHHPSNADAGQPSPVDYYVVRLWEDIQEVLPSVLEPVPVDLVDHMTSDQDTWYGAGIEDAEAALDWYSGHFMYTGFLVASPLHPLVVIGHRPGHDHRRLAAPHRAWTRLHHAEARTGERLHRVVPAGLGGVRPRTD